MADAARVFLENVIRELPRAWPEAELHVVAADDVALPSPERLSITRIGTGGTGMARVVTDLLRLPGIVSEISPDVIMSPNESIPTRLQPPLIVIAQNLMYHCPSVGPLPTGPLVARLRSRLQFAFYRRQMPRAYARADAVVAVSRHAARVLADRAGLDLARVHIVPYGADRLELEQRRPTTGSRRLLIVGAVAHFKRLEIAIKAVALLQREGAQYELVLAGEEWPGYREKLEAISRAAGVATNVKLLGSVSSEQLPTLFATAHAALSLSSCESFGIPVVEGMRAGLPAIVANEPWNQELLGDAAIRVAGSIPESVADGVRLLESEREWRRRADAGRRVAARYTWAATTAGIVNVARRLVAHAASDR